MLEKEGIKEEIKVGNSFTSLPAGKWDPLEKGYEGRCPCCNKDAYIGIVIRHV
ncbi:hypothetical protein J4461_02800 [Candidatus Pacearchaeota archaeon]|nr:hypothetical protein [Candidatus Pacearchaeota archaeon]